MKLCSIYIIVTNLLLLLLLLTISLSKATYHMLRDFRFQFHKLASWHQHHMQPQEQNHFTKSTGICQTDHLMIQSPKCLDYHHSHGAQNQPQLQFSHCITNAFHACWKGQISRNDWFPDVCCHNDTSGHCICHLHSIPISQCTQNNASHHCNSHIPLSLRH